MSGRQALVVTHKVAVKNMVSRVLRSGDLRIAFAGPHRARDGIRIHRKLQKKRPAHYVAEVPVNLLVATHNINLLVSGRIDGVYQGTDGCAIEEIKTTAQSLEHLREQPDPIHLGQALCYAYLFAVGEKLERVEVQVTYCHIETLETVTWAQKYRLSELKLRFDDITARYLELVMAGLEWQAVRNASIERLEFPFAEFRAGQREMAIHAYRTIRDRQQLLVQAATGIGKTMGALFPAIKAMADFETPLILYLTARTTGRLAAKKALAALRTRGLRLRTLTLTAKDKICFLAERACTPEECDFAKGYYNRLPAAVSSICTEDDFSRGRIEATAREFGICPFEFSLELVDWSDCLIGDYNYVFNPRVSLKRLFIESERHCIFLVDEAHNLVDRARDMFSAQLEKGAVLALRRAFGKHRPALYRSLGKINTWMLAARKQCRALPERAYAQDQAPVDLLLRLNDFVRKAERWLLENPSAPPREAVLEFYFTAVNFLKTADQFGDEYVTLLEQSDENLRVKLFCLDPAQQLKAVMDTSGAAVFFSATLTPPDYFQRLFGCPEGTACAQIGSPFRPEHLGVFIADRISTLYRRRKATLQALSEVLVALVSPQKGNYLFFFPSYEYLMMTHAAVVRECPRLNTIVQKPEMTRAEKSAFLEHFHFQPDRTLVGFAVLGGIFGEGIDLEGDKLSGAAVVGVGLPAISFENDLIKAYFDTVEGAGFQYAYQYPGFNRAMQGAGRVIRSAQDKGVVLLVDQRYTRQDYRSLLPDYWQPLKIRGNADLEGALLSFWQTASTTTPAISGCSSDRAEIK